MRVTRVSARDFRNYERVSLELGSSLTVLHGPNGAGKTNLLEALYFGCVGRSCRTSNEREMVRGGAPLTRVRVDGEAEDGRHELEVAFAPGEPKRASADGARVERLADAPVRPLVSVFLPERLDLVKGPPSPRRAHLDHLVAAVWPARAGARAEYARALAQRNALIGRIRRGLGTVALLHPWDRELARHGTRLQADRSAAVELVCAPFAARAGELGLTGPTLLRYRPRSSAIDADALTAELAARHDVDIERGFTTHGPHRDDLELSHAGRALRTYGSQGQQRLGLLALLFAERDILADHGRVPLMLLDDVMSELDAERRERLGELALGGGQVLITATDVEHVPGHGAPGAVVAHVSDGAVSPAAEAAA